MDYNNYAQGPGTEVTCVPHLRRHVPQTCVTSIFYTCFVKASHWCKTTFFLEGFNVFCSSKANFPDCLHYKACLLLHLPLVMCMKRPCLLYKKSGKSAQAWFSYSIRCPPHSLSHWEILVRYLKFCIVTVQKQCVVVKTRTTCNVSINNKGRKTAKMYFDRSILTEYSVHLFLDKGLKNCLITSWQYIVLVPFCSPGIGIVHALLLFLSKEIWLIDSGMWNGAAAKAASLLSYIIGKSIQSGSKLCLRLFFLLPGRGCLFYLPHLPLMQGGV